MENFNLVLGATHIALGALLWAVAHPLASGKIAPNRFYGVRFAKSFSSPDNWFAINRFGGQRLIFWSRVMIALGALCLLLPLQRDSMPANLLSFAPLVLVLIATMESYRFAQKL